LPVAQAFAERFPELRHSFIQPVSIEYRRSVTWIVARQSAAVLFISLDTEKFGVGFVESDSNLVGAQQYAIPELAVAAFVAAGATLRGQ
jgi:hypothetical protein